MPTGTQAASLWIEGRHRLGESILWHAARRRFFWTDLLEPALWSCDGEGQDVQSQPLALPAPIGSAAATTDPDRLILSHRGGLSLLHIDTLALEAWCNPEAGRDGIIFNDLKCDRWGRLWVSVSHDKECEPRGALWCVKDPRTWQLVDVGFPIANGPAFSVDGHTMYFNDSVNRQTLAYDIRPDRLGATGRRVFAQYTEDEGLPDGMTVDADGHVWSAQWGAACVIRFSADGRSRTRYQVPAANVTSLCFKGAGSSTLHITTASDGVDKHTLSALPLTGSLFRLVVQTQGLHEPPLHLA